MRPSPPHTTNTHLGVLECGSSCCRALQLPLQALVRLGVGSSRLLRRRQLLPHCCQLVLDSS
jgi:hypothetical protein